MCGICGFNWEDKDLVKSMSDTLEHRGPDGKGYYTDKNISLGHRRLSIIDLSNAGKQPMSNENEDIWMTYNGEIYNFKELRTELENYGHKFKSDTDTEVIIHGYEQWGESVVQKLNGMFAFAIWDSIKKKLFLARDRLGIKPLYYYLNKKNKKLIFASEIKAILIHGIKKEINLNATRNYLRLRYVPGKETLFKNIQKLLPGHTFTLQNNQIHINQFWDVPLPKIKKDPLVVKKVRNLLLDSVKKRLISDVPIGVYLSGGIDSATITALSSHLNDKPVKTFSVGFNHEKFDELSKAKKIADYFNTDHHEIMIDGNISGLLPKLIWQLDLPHGDPVIIPQFKLSELASKKVKVVLSGEGADEIYGGYAHYKTFMLGQKIKFFPKIIIKNFAKVTPVKILDKMYDYPSSIGNKGKEKVIDYLSNLKNKEQSYFNLISITSKKDQKLLFSAKLKINQQKEYLQKKRNTLNKVLYYDTKKWLPNYPLFINDRMTMANSIEGRVPFLDHRLVEHSTTLPHQFKLNGKITKSILRIAMQGILPQTEIKKQAFLMPLDKWYKEELKDLAQDLFSPANVQRRGYFNHYHLQKVWNNYNQSKLIYGKQLFTLINFELWHRQFIDNKNILKKEMKLSELI